MKIVLPEFIDILPSAAIDELKKYGEVITFPDFPANEDKFIERIGDADVLISKWFTFTEKTLAHASQLKHIVTLSAGFGQLPGQAARANNITLSNCPTHNSQAVAEHAIALLFAVKRRIVEAQLTIQHGLWRESPYSYQGSEVMGKKMGIIGYGKIGRHIGQRAEGLGMKVYGVTSQSSPAELHELCQTSDVIVVAVPASPATQGLITRELLHSMKPTAVIINIARGNIIDQHALIEALRSHKIAGAGLDVADGEVTQGPATEEIIALSKLPNVVITPHIAYNTIESAQRMGEEMVANVKAIAEGKPINVVN